MSAKKLQSQIAKLEKEIEDENDDGDDAKRQVCSKCHHYRDQYHERKKNGVSCIAFWAFGGFNLIAIFTENGSASMPRWSLQRFQYMPNQNPPTSSRRKEATKAC
jgi:hypothetical protein